MLYSLQYDALAFASEELRYSDVKKKDALDGTSASANSPRSGELGSIDNPIVLPTNNANDR